MKWEKLLSALNDLEADMICGLLENEGILTQRKYSGINQYLKIVMGPVVEVEIWVPYDRITEARQIIEAFSKGVIYNGA